MLIDINCPFQKLPELGFTASPWPAWLCKGKFLLFSLSKDTKFSSSGGNWVPGVSSGYSSLAGSCVLLVSHVLPALAARGEKLISGHWFWLHLQGNFIHRQLPSGHAWVSKCSSSYIPEELLTPSAQVGNGHRAGGCHKHPANLTCSFWFPSQCPFQRGERAKNSSV